MAKKYIERDALMDFANNHVNGIIDTNDIARFPAADVVEVVRCKDCKQYNSNGCADGFGWCEELNRGMTDEKFCSYGERRDNE